MTIDAYRDEIKLRLTGGVLKLEINDADLDKVINAALREVQRYISTTKIVTLPYQQCINLKDYKVNSVTEIYRTEGYTNTQSMYGVVMDPLYAAQWQLMSSAGGISNINSYVNNFASWNTLLQIRNTISTDMAYYYDKSTENLYINVSGGTPCAVTIEFVPRYDSVEEITSDYWIDILMRLSVALAKVTVGRVRSRYTQSNALWENDGQRLLEEGNAELDALREHLVTNTALYYTKD